MSSWLKAVRGSNKTVFELISMYPVNSLGALEPSRFPTVADSPDVQMAYEIIGRSAMTWDYLSWRLYRSHLYVVIDNGGAYSHAVVVYGLGGGGPFTVYAMDPMKGRGVSIPLTSFRPSGTKFLVGWKLEKSPSDPL